MISCVRCSGELTVAGGPSSSDPNEQFWWHVGPIAQPEQVQKEVWGGEGEAEMASDFCFYSFIEV